MPLKKNKSTTRLKKLQKEGYLFHGSPTSDIQILAPRLARDADSSQGFNNDTAIFASKDFVGPIIFAICDRKHIPEELKDLSWGLGWYNNKAIASLPKQWKQYLTDKTGYIYVLPPNTFEPSPQGNQLKSKEAVTPIESIPVTIEDFLEAEGQINWLD